MEQFKLKKSDEDQLLLEIEHILESGVNKTRLMEMIKRFVGRRFVYKENTKE